MMGDKNPHALALGFRKARGKLRKIGELGIQPDWTQDNIDDCVISLAKAKAKREGSEDWKQYLKGQQWYVEDLVKFSGLATSKEKLEVEYDMAFPDVAEEEEMLAELDSLS